MPKKPKTIKAWAIVVNGEPLFPLFRNKEEAKNWQFKKDFRCSVKRVEIKILK